MKKYFTNSIVIAVLFLTILPLSPSNSFAARSDVEAFVTRFYQQCLNRGPDTPGLIGWSNALSDGTLSGSDIAYGFIFSDEFINFDTTNEDFVTILYRVFFDREPDPSGYEAWLNLLNNYTLSKRVQNVYLDLRELVLDGFIYSKEFENLCNRYGIAPYSA